MKKEFLIKAFWDMETGVWVATSDDVPGLVTEAVNMELLIKKLKDMIPELLELNGIYEKGTEIPFSIMSEYSDYIHG